MKVPQKNLLAEGGAKKFAAPEDPPPGETLLADGSKVVPRGKKSSGKRPGGKRSSYGNR